MCFKKWFRKREKPVVLPAEEPVKTMPAAAPEPQPVPIPAPEATPVPKPEPAPQATPAPVAGPAPEPIPEPAQVIPQAPAPEPAPKPEAKVEAAKPAASGRYAGKYEVFPEAGLFKFRLKASNGEILVVSQGYSKPEGAKGGIDTFKKNVEGGVFEVYTDKSGYSQFLLFSANKSRLLATGEFYETEARAASAIESVRKFASTEKVVVLEELPAAEVREQVVTLKPVEANPNGRLEVATGEDGEWTFTLKASNAEVLFISNGYASKSGALAGLEAVKKAVEAGNFRISQDKQKRFQFRLYAANGQMILTGETYPNTENCLSAVDSVRRFLAGAKIVQ